MLGFLGHSFTWRELLDIGIVASVYYYLIHLVRGTRAVAVIYGLALLVLLHYLSGELGLYTVHWLLTQFLGSIFLVVVILFRRDIRKGLAQVGAGRLWVRAPVVDEVLQDIVQAVMSMARTKTGALIVMEKRMPLGDIVERGYELDAKLSKELLFSIFNTASPLHDGAVIVRQGRITAAGCILPLHTGGRRQSHFGTRHRAALGISEESDALAIVVSEERGAVSIAVGGRMTVSLDENRLERVIRNAMER